MVGCYNLTRTGVERETKLTIEQQPLVLVIFMELLLWLNLRSQKGTTLF